MKKHLYALAAVAAVSGTASAVTLSFEGVKVPQTDQEKRSILASPQVTVDGKSYPIGYHVIARSGQRIGKGIFGQIFDKEGKPVYNKDGSVKISNSNDFASLIKKGEKLFMVSHFETRPAAVYITELEQNRETGDLKPLWTRNIDFSKYNGLWVPCAGSVTPWNTHLGSEEYPPNARKRDAQGNIDKYYAPMADYIGGDLKALNPYDYGFVTEIKVLDEKGHTEAQKHYAMGRFAHELAYAMPDQKTVYMSDDGTNGIFGKFVADYAGDLSSGELFAAKWKQTSATDGGSADIEWVSLGKASDTQVRAALDKRPLFDDIFEVAKRAEDGSCPAGFLPSNYRAEIECLKVKEGMETAASRLETGRYASMQGATVEFAKMEGITYNPQKHEAYMSISRVEKGMEDNMKRGKKKDKYDKGGNNDIRLPWNHCGTVYRLGLDAGYNVVKMQGLISGTPMPKDADGNSCTLDNISMPDNVTFIPNSDTLIIGEDTSYHQNDMIWAYTLTDKKLTRIQTTPYGSETTSPYYYPDVNGHGYLMSVVQHPFGESDEDKLQNPDEAHAYTGYVGPFLVIK